MPVHAKHLPQIKYFQIPFHSPFDTNQRHRKLDIIFFHLLLLLSLSPSVINILIIIRIIKFIFTLFFHLLFLIHTKLRHEQHEILVRKPISSKGRIGRKNKIYFTTERITSGLSPHAVLWVKNHAHGTPRRMHHRSQ